MTLRCYRCTTPLSARTAFWLPTSHQGRAGRGTVPIACARDFEKVVFRSPFMDESVYVREWNGKHDSAAFPGGTGR